MPLRLARRARLRAGRILLLVAGLAPVIASAWAIEAMIVRTAEETALSAGLQRAASTTLAAEFFARHMLEDAAVFHRLAQQWSVFGAEGKLAERTALEAAMRALVNQPLAPMAHLAIAGPDGSMTWHSRTGLQTYSVHDRPQWQKARDGAADAMVGAVLLSRAVGLPVIPVSQRLADAGGGFAGLAIAQFDPAEITQRLAALTDRPSEVVALLRTEGDILARSVGAPEIGRAVLQPEQARAVIEQGSLTLRTLWGERQRDVLVGLRHVSGTNLIVAALVDTNTVLAETQPVRVLARSVTAVFSITLALVLLVGASELRSRSLRRQAEALRSGRAEIERLHRHLPVVIFLLRLRPDGSCQAVYGAGDTATVTGWPDRPFETEADWRACMAPGDLDMADAAAQALAEGTLRFDFRLRQPDGTWRWMEARLDRLTVTPEDGGEVVGYIRDCSAERAAQAQAQAARQELDRTLARAPVVVFRADVSADGTYYRSYINDSVDRVMGWTAAEFTALGGLRSVMDEPEALNRGIEATLRDGEWGGDIHIRRRDGRRMVLRMTMSVMDRHADGSCTVVGYFADITGERQAEMRAIASARLASLGEMSAGLAHELKQPLQAISLAAGNAQAAMRRNDATAAGQRLERIIGYAQRAGSVIENLRRFARGAERGAPAVPVPIEDAIAGALSVLGGTMRDAGIELRPELETPRPVALGQIVVLEQVLTNLLLNARDAMAQLPDNALRRITIRAGTDAAVGAVRLEVADTAGGIPPEVMGRLFEPFVTTKGPEHGTGLGLSICHGLLREMGGSITAANEGLGAVFRIVLPAAPAGARAAEAAE